MPCRHVPSASLPSRLRCVCATPGSCSWGRRQRRHHRVAIGRNGARRGRGRAVWVSCRAETKTTPARVSIKGSWLGLGRRGPLDASPGRGPPGGQQRPLHFRVGLCCVWHERRLLSALGDRTNLPARPSDLPPCGDAASPYPTGKSAFCRRR
jgi:hypothetical protein